MNTTEITVTMNGQSMSVPRGTTVRELLNLADIRSQLVVVERNLEIVRREDHANCQIADQDVIEAVTLVGGG